MNDEIRELSIEDIEQVSGGDLLNTMIDKAMANIGAALLNAVHQPVTPPISLHFD